MKKAMKPFIKDLNCQHCGLTLYKYPMGEYLNPKFRCLKVRCEWFGIQLKIKHFVTLVKEDQ